ncbi:MAG: ferrochelatase [Gammaproteobacteria bacterium]|nr:ferrochelatase [Gammaproteobacteria bacterium]
MSNTNPPKIGVLITNLGTPDQPTPSAVKKYLKEFLWDPFIVQIPRPLWWLILNGIILRTRPKKSAKLYQKIWTKSGSPLLVFSSELVRKLRGAMTSRGYTFKYALGMRYGEPSIKQALINLREQGVTQIIGFPLYPQYSTTTTASTVHAIKKQLQQLKWEPTLHFIENYAYEPSYISALAHTIHNHWQKQIPGQKLLFSFHGIPKKLIAKGDPYFDQCLDTAAQVASKLNLEEKKWGVVFQSRFGREEWLQPYCNKVLQDLPKEGYKHIDVICPGFAVDCLETLEEMAITNKKIFHQAGGLIYNYISALNTTDLHIQSLSDILIKNANLKPFTSTLG